MSISRCVSGGTTMVDSGAAITAGPVELIAGYEPRAVEQRRRDRLGSGRREHDHPLAGARGRGVADFDGARARRELVDDPRHVHPQVVDLRGVLERDAVGLVVEVAERAVELLHVRRR